jgi:two-component system, chemotaxis family, response regulator PixG
MNTTVLQESVANPIKDNAVLVEHFTASKQTNLFDTLKQIKFCGQLILTENQGTQWNFHLCQGHILYVTGGTHFVKRWLRNMQVTFPQINANPAALKEELDNIAGKKHLICWQYQLLSNWVKQQKITHEQATRIVWLIFVEVLFNLARAKEITYELKAENLRAEGIITVDIRQAISEADRQLKLWQTIQVNFAPDRVPVIKEAEQLQQNTSSSVYQALKKLLDGRRTLRDLALKMNRDVVRVTSSLLPFIQLGLIELTNVADAIAPISIVTTDADKPQKPLIACVDDSRLICHLMETILFEAGYRSVSINNPLKSINILLALKPDLIFLDLIMPNLNGYQVCQKLRKYSHLRNTPIIILTANDGMIDRARAKIVGASGFLSKSKVDTQKVLNVAQKHLKNHSLSKISQL